MSTLLIVDDDRALCRSLQIQLEGEGHTVRYALNAADGLTALAQDKADLVLVDLGLPDRSGLEVLREVRADEGAPPVVMITGQQDMRATIEAMRAGAIDYVRKPFALEDVLLLLEKLHAYRDLQNRKSRRLAVGPGAEAPNEIIGADRKVVEVIKQIGLLSRTQVTVLIEGESGTGKELVARALHEATSPEENFVPINCSAVVSTLMESELFGHEKGAFTGADTTKTGKLEHAGEGTVFFDEIGEISPELQAKILRVLQEREFERVGGLEARPFRARVVAATNRSLEDMVKGGEFREDLFYRLAVSRLRLPALRERRGDLPLLVRHLLDRIGRTLHRRVTAIEDRAMQRLQAYDWPGNVRELENVLTRAVALSHREILTTEDLEVSLGPPLAGRAATEGEVVPLHAAERAHIEKALAVAGWNITRTARLLEISPTTLRKKIADYRLEDPR